MSAVLDAQPLGFPWQTVDPFLFCAYHDDAYPKGDDALGPDAPLAGRRLGMDFSRQNGWSMYHGSQVPGFPQHPHRGFETITIARSGFVDHSDSLGATARFGAGDVQWMTAGRGVVHSEMFPLLEKDRENPLELFQIWLNLPAEDKMVEPHFAMLWGEKLPEVTTSGGSVTVYAGRLGDELAPPPPPHSWAAREDSDVAIYGIHMSPEGRWTIPAATGADTVRTLYFFDGESVTIDDRDFTEARVVLVRSDVALDLAAGPGGCELLMLQGRPIGEPVVQHGPFVMNTRSEIQQAMADYQKTQFGGWPWGSAAPVHARDAGRFARHADGREEQATG